MNYFTNIKGLAELEQQEKWDDVRKLLYEIWVNDKLDNGKLIRLLSECWYLLAEWDCWVKGGEQSFKTFKNVLIECTEFGMKNFMNNPRFLCVAGYMITMFPYLFFWNGTDRLYTEWEKKGAHMLRKAYELDPLDKVIEILNLGCASDLQEYNKAKKSIQPELEKIFPGDTEIEIYFKAIMSIK